MPQTSYKILHCADLHLDSPLLGLEAYPDAPVTRIRDATRDALTNLVTFAIREQVAVVLIAGDIYDRGHIDSRTGLFFLAALKRLVDAGIEVVAISGNHDADSELVHDHKTRWPSGPKASATMLPTDRAGTVVIEDLNLAIHGQGFQAREITEDLIQFYPEPRPGALNIGLLHTSADGKSKHDKYAPTSYEKMASHGYDYWALGHVHTRRMERRGDCLMVFPGNLQGRDVGEAGPKGASIVTVTNGRIVREPEHHDFNVVWWTTIECDVSGARDLEAVLAVIRTHISEALSQATPRLLAARLVVCGRTGAHAALLRTHDLREKILEEASAAGASENFWLEKLIIKTKPNAERAPVSPMEALLRQHVAAPPSDASLYGAREWARAVWEKYPPLRARLGEEHSIAKLSAGQMDEDLLADARALLLARLDG